MQRRDWKRAVECLDLTLVEPEDLDSKDEFKPDKEVKYDIRSPKIYSLSSEARVLSNIGGTTKSICIQLKNSSMYTSHGQN